MVGDSTAAYLARSDPDTMATSCLGISSPSEQGTARQGPLCTISAEMPRMRTRSQDSEGSDGRNRVAVPMPAHAIPHGRHVGRLDAKAVVGEKSAEALAAPRRAEPGPPPARPSCRQYTRLEP